MSHYTYGYNVYVNKMTDTFNIGSDQKNSYYITVKDNG